MYGRSYGDQTLNFEPSGALRDAALVMRDRETDSWWSIMTSDAIGGPLEGTDLQELPIGEKTTWGEWRAEHPDSLVLSVDGVEHDSSNPYENYFTSDDTFRDLEVEDDRLAAKAPVYTFRRRGTAYAAPHTAIEGGALFPAGDDEVFFLHREPGASVFAGTDAWVLSAERAEEIGSPQAVRSWIASPTSDSAPDASRLTGFDTYWYTWVAVHPETELLERGGEDGG